MPVPIRVIIADDHELFRDGFAAMFANIDKIELVDQASNGALLVALVDKHNPDVVVTDIQMDTMNGIEATKIIKQRHPKTSVIGMSMFDDNCKIIDMLRAGANGYLVKNAQKQVVKDAIIAAYKGENYYCRTTSEKLSALISSGRYDPKSGAFVDFTGIELRIIKMICMDKESKQIATELGLSLASIGKYRMDIMEKAEVKTTTGLIMYAIRNGIYKP